MGDSLHTVLDQELVHVAIRGHEEVSGINFRDNKFDLKLSDKAL